MFLLLGKVHHDVSMVKHLERSGWETSHDPPTLARLKDVGQFTGNREMKQKIQWFPMVFGGFLWFPVL